MRMNWNRAAKCSRIQNKLLSRLHIEVAIGPHFFRTVDGAKVNESVEHYRKMIRDFWIAHVNIILLGTKLFHLVVKPSLYCYEFLATRI